MASSAAFPEAELSHTSLATFSQSDVCRFIDAVWWDTSRPPQEWYCLQEIEGRWNWRHHCQYWRNCNGWGKRCLQCETLVLSNQVSELKEIPDPVQDSIKPVPRKHFQKEIPPGKLSRYSEAMNALQHFGNELVWCQMRLSIAAWARCVTKRLHRRMSLNSTWSEEEFKGNLLGRCWSQLREWICICTWKECFSTNEDLCWSLEYNMIEARWLEIDASPLFLRALRKRYGCVVCS